MSEIKVNEIKHALSNTIGSIRVLSTTVTQEKVKTHLIIQKVEELTKRLDKLDLMIKQSKKANKAVKTTPKEIVINN